MEGESLSEHEVRERRRNLRQNLELLSHAVYCPISTKGQITCENINCAKMKGYLKHFEACKISRNSCDSCHKVEMILQFHAQSCQIPGCQIPQCLSNPFRGHSIKQQMPQEAGAPPLPPVSDTTFESDSLEVESELTSLHCGICFEHFDDGLRVPTTFPCGHTCCLRHAAFDLKQKCHVCRSLFPPVVKLSPNYALRDCAVLALVMKDRKRKAEFGNV